MTAETGPPTERQPRSGRDRLAAALAQGLVVAPGAYDALSARLLVQAGFESVYLTGFGISASSFGVPDIGLVTGSEMVEAVRRMTAAAVPVPTIADADNGYGGLLNVQRTVRAYEQAGVAALQLEDQVFPKRCGHMAGKEVVDAGEAIARVRAAVDARTDPQLQIIARTDLAAVSGIDAAIDRARSLHDAGADLLFVEAPRRRADIEQVAGDLAGIPLVFNWVEGGLTENPTLDELADLGFRLVIFPISTLLATAKAVRDVAVALRADAGTDNVRDQMVDFTEFTGLIGLEEMRASEARLAP